MDHPLNLRCHPLQFVCSPFKVEGEGELIDEVVIEMVVEVVVEMVREVVVHLSRHFHHYHPLQYLHLILPYPPPPPLLTHHPILPYPPILTHHHLTLPYLPITRYFFTPSDLHIFTSPVLPEPASMAVNIITLSSHPLSSPRLPPIDETDETMVDLISELGALPARRPRAPRTRVFHP